jgi:hypothetical protein
MSKMDLLSAVLISSLAAFGLAPAGEPLRQKLTNNDTCALVAWPMRIVAHSLSVIAAGAGDRQITRIIGIISYLRGERGCCSFAKPSLWYDMFQRCAAQRFAVDAKE